MAPGGSPCGAWQSPQRPCCFTLCKPMSFAGAWHVEQAGGDAVPPGPCGRWQSEQLLRSLP